MKNILDKIKFFLKNHGDIFLYFLTVFLIVVTLFKPGYIFLTDYTSGPMQNYGSGMWGLIHNFFLLIFSQASVQKIVIALSFLSVLFGGKKIVGNFIANKYVVFAMSLFALFNPYVYERTGYGQFAVILAYGFLLFTVGYLLKYILNFSKEGYKIIENDSKLSGIINKIGNNLNLVLAFVFTGISLSFSPHFLFFVGTFWIMFLVFAILNFKKIFKKGFIISIFVSIVLFSIINLNYVLSFVNKEDTYASSILKTGITHQDLLAFATSDISGLCIDRFSGDCGFSSFANIEKDVNGNETLKFNKNNRSFGALYNVISMSGFWGKDQYRFHDITKDRFIFNFSFFIVFGLAIYGYIKSKEYFKARNSKFLSNFLLGSFIIATILAVGIRSEIFRNFNFFLFDHLPFYQGIREPQKWVSVLCAIYLVFLSITVKEIVENYDFRKNKKNIIYLSVSLSVLFILRAPYTLFGFSNQVVATEYPNDWYQIDKILWEDENKCGGKKVVFLPWHLYMHFDFMGQISFDNEIIGNRIVANPSPIFFRCPTIYGTNMEWGGIYDSVYDKNDIAIQNWFKSNLKESKFLKEIDAGYILIAKEVDYQSFMGLLNLDYVQLIKETSNFYLFKIK